METKSTKTDAEIEAEIKELLEVYVTPAVEAHGGAIHFVGYEKGDVHVMLSGACSGCSGSTATLKFGVENMLKHHLPEIQNVYAEDDPNSMVDPYWTMDDGLMMIDEEFE